MEYYRSSLEAVITALQTDRQQGLSTEQASLLLKKKGKNKLNKRGGRPLWKIILEQFTSLLVVLLIAAGGLSWYLGEMRDAIILFVIVIINAGIGFFQEYKSEKIVSSLQHLIKEKTTVVRDGKEKEIWAEELVPGDIVLLQEGDGVPADLRLIESENFATNDGILTGESEPQKKSHTIVIDHEVPLTNQDNCVFMGVTVVRGFARGVVIATGMQTEIGKIAQTSMSMREEPSPLQKEIGNLAVTITKITIVLAVFLFAIRWFSSHESFQNTLIFAVGIAAAMVPEGMPAQISVALSLGVSRLAYKKAIIKRLSSVETLGAATVIASDKTGTITKNEMTIKNCYVDGDLFTVTGTGYGPSGNIFDSTGRVLDKQKMEDLKVFFLDGYLASTGRVNAPDEEHTGWYALGDPTEAAFATLALKAGFHLEDLDKAYQIEKIYPFDSIRKCMSIVRLHKGKRIVFAKGAIESLLQRSRFLIQRGNIRLLQDSEKQIFLEMTKIYTSQANRVLALAYKDLDHAVSDESVESIEKDLIFAGFVAMEDPPHNEVKMAIQSAFDAHVKVVMITGDNAFTAKAIANQIGMTQENGDLPTVLESQDLTKMSDDTLGTLLQQRAVIFSRVSPQDKYRIVELLKQRGEIVAVTGDGVNDALSLKAAHIGVSMGEKGSQVAKEASDMILLNDNFSTIVLAIQEGRVIYKNLEKTIRSSLTSNFGELFCVLLGFCGGIYGLPLPISAIQILAVDLVGEMLPLTALTFDPAESSLMKDPPRDIHHHIVDFKKILQIMIFGFFMGLMGFITFLLIYNGTGDAFHIAQARSGAYATIVLCQFMNILSRRTEKTVFTRYLFTNQFLWATLAISLFFVFAIVYVPLLQYFLQTAGLAPLHWLFIVGGAVVYLMLHEIRKIFIHQPLYNL